MHSKIVTLVFLLICSTFSSLNANEPFDVGMLACVLQLERIEPSQPIGATAGITASAYSSAFLIRDPDFPAKGDVLKSRVFLVTAAHNLVDCNDVQVSIPVTSGAGETESFSLFTTTLSPLVTAPNRFGIKYLQGHAYFDQAEDLAIIEASEDWALILNSQPLRMVGQLLPPDEESANTLPRGGIASAAGTIHETGLDAIHPAYSCTLSRYILGSSQIINAVDPAYKLIDPSSESDDDVFHRGVYDRIKALQFLMIESMSITAGFSGSPVMISSDHFRKNGEIVGVVLGGQPNPEVGRSAWVMPSETIKKAVRILKSVNARPEIAVGEYREVPGRWVFNRDLANVKKVLGERFRTPYATKFSIESRVEFKGDHVGATLCGNDLRNRIAKLPGRSFVFRQIKFDKGCLDNVNLLTPYFDRCSFEATTFTGSVLSGPTFYKCEFTDAKKNQVKLSEIVASPCPACSPAAIVAAIVIEKMDTDHRPSGLPAQR